MLSENRKSSKKLAELLDSRFKIPNTNIRFGLDPIISLIPGAGDVFAGIISLYFLIQGAIHGGKSAVLGRMFINILLDVLVGAIPILGDAFDIYWKANLRNARILDELQQDPGKATSESRLWIWFVVIQFVVIIIGIILFIGWAIAEIMDLLF